MSAVPMIAVREDNSKEQPRGELMVAVAVVVLVVVEVVQDGE